MSKVRTRQDIQLLFDAIEEMKDTCPHKIVRLYEDVKELNSYPCNGKEYHRMYVSKFRRERDLELKKLRYHAKKENIQNEVKDTDSSEK